MRRSLKISLAAILLATGVVLAATLASGHSPKLGLDLQGGASVVLAPANGTTVKPGTLSQAIAIIRRRVDGLGVAEADVSQQGNDIVVELPGIKNQTQALDLVGQTAQLEFRPVVGTLAGGGTLDDIPESIPAPGTPQNPSYTPRDSIKPDVPVVLPEVAPGTKNVDAKYELDKAALFGNIVSSADAIAPQGLGGGWTVNVHFTGSGSSQFDALAKQYYQRQVAIVLDGVVISAPTIQAQQFNGTAVISGNGSTGGFSHSAANNLALVLRYGSLPIKLDQQAVQTVSATLGHDSLRAGLVAGVIGLILVLLYMILYYRALGLVVVVGLSISGALLYSIITYLGQTQNLALSLAGATGIIVSVGVTADSYIVYFERLKDEIRGGRTVRSSVDRGFGRAWRTIVSADAVSFIGAALLWWLTVGAVRGFAFMLGLSTLLDLLTAYTFTRPMVVLLGRNRTFTEARFLGVARGLAVTPVEAAA